MVGPEISRRLPHYPQLKITFFQGFGAFMLLGVSYMHNYLAKRPMRASVLKHVSAVIAGFVVGSQIDIFRASKLSAKVVIIEDYISKHPEDFPLVTPKKYKDVLLTWTPLR